MLLQRQHILLSYFKTLSVGPAEVWTRDSSPVLAIKKKSKRLSGLSEEIVLLWTINKEDSWDIRRNVQRKIT